MWDEEFFSSFESTVQNSHYEFLPKNVISNSTNIDLVQHLDVGLETFFCIRLKIQLITCDEKFKNLLNLCILYFTESHWGKLPDDVRYNV